MNRLPATTYKPCPRAVHGTRRVTRRIILHTIQGSAQGALSWFNSPQNPYGTGAQLVISQHKAYQTWDIDALMWHCKNANADGVGIEHEGYAEFSKAKWLSKANRKMLRMSANRCAYLCYHYRLGRPRLGKNVFYHSMVPGNDHTDVGKGFPKLFYFDVLCRRAYARLVKTKGREWE